MHGLTSRFLCAVLNRGLESPSIPLTGSNIGSILASDRPSAAGINVTRDSALAVPALKAGVELIASDVAKLPISVFSRTAGGNKQELRTHPAARLLRQKSNKWITSHTLIKTLIGHALLHRGGYAQVFRDSAGRPESMDLLDPEETYPIVVEGELLYQTRIIGEERLLPADRVLHIKPLGYDGLSGWSLIDKLREAIGLALASQQYAAVYFSNNAKPSVVIKFPGYLKDEMAVRRFRESWGQVHAGVANSQRPAILEGGAEVAPFSVSNEDSQFIESRQFDVRQIAAALKIPPHKLGDDSRTSFASLEQENQRYLDEAIDPWLREFEVAAADKLLSLSEWQAGTSIEFNRAAFVRSDISARFEAYNKAIQAGWMSRADVRRKENLNVDDASLEEYLQPANMVPSGTDPNKQAPPVFPNEDIARSRLEATTRHQISRFLVRLKKDAHRASVAVRAGVKTDADLRSWIDCLPDKHGEILTRDLAAICGEEPAKEIVDAFFSSLRSDLISAADVPAAQLPDTIRQLMAAQLADKPDLITREVLSWQIPVGAD